MNEIKTFNDFLDEMDTTVTEPIAEDTSIVDETTEEPISEELPITEDVVSPIIEDTEEPVTKEVSTSKEAEEVTNFNAFADMRVKNKELQQEKVRLEAERQAFEELAISLGYNDSKEMLEASNKKNLESEAKAQNIPVEVLQRIKALEAENEVAREEKRLFEQERKELALVNSIESFKNANNLSEEKVMNTIAKLGEDGFDYESLTQLPEKSIAKLLNSYLDKEIVTQKEIEKQAIKVREIPMTPVDKNEDVVKQAEDDLFKLFSGQTTYF